MSLRRLLRNQIIRIDDHKRGNREVKNWDKKNIDVHLDKRTKYKIDGKVRDVTIRIPLNSDREVRVHINGTRYDKIPNQLLKEIQDSLSENSEKLDDFVTDIVSEINDYKSLLEEEKKAIEALNRLAKHFELDWKKEKIATYVNDKLVLITQLYSSVDDESYYVSLSPEYIELSNTTKGSKHEVRLSKFRNRK